MTDNEILSKELLNYLARVPKNLLNHGPGYLGYFSLDLGKCLIWLSHRLQPGTPQRFQPVGEYAESVFALGEQFRVTGLEIIDKQTKVQLSQIDSLKTDLDEMHRRLLLLESKGGQP